MGKIKWSRRRLETGGAGLGGASLERSLRLEKVRMINKVKNCWEHPKCR